MTKEKAMRFWVDILLDLKEGFWWYTCNRETAKGWQKFDSIHGSGCANQCEKYCRADFGKLITAYLEYEEDDDGV